MNCSLLYWANDGLSLHLLLLIMYMYQCLADLLACTMRILKIKSLVNILKNVCLMKNYSILLLNILQI